MFDLALRIELELELDFDYRRHKDFEELIFPQDLIALDVRAHMEFESSGALFLISFSLPVGS